jgi:UDP-2-acetamido-2,6-beta-L-arabino-hexul-4-ose reductase
MKIVVTGANGLLGYHIRCHLGALEAYRESVVAFDRQAFNDDSLLSESLKGAAAVIHCAGINRDDDSVVENGNREVAERLVDSLKASGSKPHLFYANSTQRESDNAYGRGKSAAHRVLAVWAEEQGARYSELCVWRRRAALL